MRNHQCLIIQLEVSCKQEETEFSKNLYKDKYRYLEEFRKSMLESGIVYFLTGIAKDRLKLCVNCKTINETKMLRMTLYVYEAHLPRQEILREIMNKECTRIILEFGKSMIRNPAARLCLYVDVRERKPIKPGKGDPSECPVFYEIKKRLMCLEQPC